MGYVGPYVQLRPLGGGREWDALPAEVRPATREERLRAALTVANAHSSRGALGKAPPPAIPPGPPPPGH
ncbi:hypothetical protein [Streptomyces pacificus]|uniref:hypothetical protein n=1 Tax=Streptomyces pacificus TaxID=2705029 RepID=UPI0020B14B70|nr:hypothetical protein [Streptomyces pacificus]